MCVWRPRGIEGLHWYDGAQGIHDPTAPSLAVALVNGKVQLTRGTRDDNPVLIDTGMKLTQARARQRARPLHAPV